MRYLVSVVAFMLCVATPAASQAEIVSPAASQAGELPDVQPVQIQLTPDIIERYLSSIQDVMNLAGELDHSAGSNKTEPAEDMAFLLVPHLFDPKAEQRINAMLKTHGFETYADWANAAHSIGIAMEAASFGNVEDLGSQKSAARKDIETDKTLSDEDKAKALDELESQFAALAEFEPLPGNREAVQPFLVRLRAANGD